MKMITNIDEYKMIDINKYVFLHVYYDWHFKSNSLFKFIVLNELTYTYRNFNSYLILKHAKTKGSNNVEN